MRVENAASGFFAIGFDHEGLLLQRPLFVRYGIHHLPAGHKKGRPKAALGSDTHLIIPLARGPFAGWGDAVAAGPSSLHQD